MHSHDLLEKRALQLHVYKYAVEYLLQQSVESSAYCFMRESSRQRVELTQKNAEESQESLIRVLRVIDEGMRSGNCWPYPDKNVCRNCNIKTACGQGRLINKWDRDSEQTAGFKSIREGDHDKR